MGSSGAYYQTFHHHVVLQDLVPNTLYFYIVGDESDGFSKEFSFKSAPLSSTFRGNFTFPVFGDLGVVMGNAFQFFFIFFFLINLLFDFKRWFQY